MAVVHRHPGRPFYFCTFTQADGEAMPSATVRARCARWLAAKEIETEPATHARYSSIIAAFLDSLGKNPERDLATLRALFWNPAGRRIRRGNWRGRGRPPALDLPQRFPAGR